MLLRVGSRGSRLALTQAELAAARLRRPGVEIVSEYREAIAEIPGPTEVSFQEWREGPPLEPAVELHLRGDDFEVLRAIVDDIITNVDFAEAVEQLGGPENLD